MHSFSLIMLIPEFLMVRKLLFIYFFLPDQEKVTPRPTERRSGGKRNQDAAIATRLSAISKTI